MRLKRKRCPVTLLEMMIVILLIGVIGGVLSYNLKGTLDRGKEFRSKEGAHRLAEILNLEIEMGRTTIAELFGDDKVIDSNKDTVVTCVRRSGFVPTADVNAFVVDGWKEPYAISMEDKDLVVVKEQSKIVELPVKPNKKGKGVQ